MTLPDNPWHLSQYTKDELADVLLVLCRPVGYTHSHNSNWSNEGLDSHLAWACPTVTAQTAGPGPP